MKKQRTRYRNKTARDIKRDAVALGYDCMLTQTGHLRLVHRINGAIVVAPSKGGGRLIKNTYARLKREAGG